MTAAPTGATRPSAARLVRDRARTELVAAITAAGARQLAEARGAWELAQERTHRALGPDAAPVLDQWIGELLPAGP